VRAHARALSRPLAFLSAPLEPSEDLVAIVEQCRASGPPAADASNFAFLAHALSGFMAEEGGGLPPVTGAIPDMEADNPK